MTPSMHTSHPVPPAGMYSPLAHAFAVHVAPTETSYPLSHTYRGGVPPSDTACSVAVQCANALLPAGDVASPHVAHVAAEVAPVAVEYVSAPHAEQLAAAVSPPSADHVPAGHGVHAAPV